MLYEEVFFNSAMRGKSEQINNKNMKQFNEKHNAIINSNETPSIANPKNGEICNHFEKVDYIEFYHPISEKKFIQVKLKRDFILDLAEQIKNIESDRVQRRRGFRFC